MSRRAANTLILFATEAITASGRTRRAIGEDTQERDRLTTHAYAPGTRNAGRGSSQPNPGPRLQGQIAAAEATISQHADRDDHQMG